MCIILRLGRKGLKEAKKASPLRMSTTIGGRRERRWRKPRVGFLVESTGKVIRKAIRKAGSWLCPCRRLELRSTEQRGPLSGFVLNFKTPEWR